MVLMVALPRTCCCGVCVCVCRGLVMQMPHKHSVWRCPITYKDALPLHSITALGLLPGATPLLTKYTPSMAAFPLSGVCTQKPLTVAFSAAQWRRKWYAEPCTLREGEGVSHPVDKME